MTQSPVAFPFFAELSDAQGGVTAFSGGDAHILVNDVRFSVPANGFVSLLELGAVSRVKFAYDDTEFRVRTMYVVPIPAALPLFLTALAGVGLAARRRGRTGRAVAGG